MLRIPQHSAAIAAAGHDLRHVRTYACVFVCVYNIARVQLRQLSPSLCIPQHSAVIAAAGHDLRHVRTYA